jgi:hypothetical protein
MTRRPVSSTRRAALALALVALVTTAGCSGFLGSGSEDAPGVGAAKLDSVPADATMVGYVDVDGMAGDDSLRDIANAALEAQSARYGGGGGDKPASVSGMLATVENETGLSLTQVDGITFFGTVPKAGAGGSGSQSARGSGMIVTAGFEESALLDSLRDSGYQPTEQTHAGTTMYTYGMDGRQAIAMLEDGTFAMGHVDAVESVLEVRAGDAAAVGGELRDEFGATDEGYVRFAASVPQDQLPVGELQTDAPVDPSNLNTVQYVSGSLATSGDTVTAKLNLVDESSNSATRTRDLVRGGLAYYQGTAPEDVRPALEALEVDQDGDTVTVTYSENADRIEAMITSLYSSS